MLKTEVRIKGLMDFREILCRLFPKVFKKTKCIYEIGSMEHKEDGGMGWRDYITPELIQRKYYVINPCYTEKAKTGYSAGDSQKYLLKLKKSGQKEKHDEIMGKIWMADLQAVRDCTSLVLKLEPEDKPGGTIVEMVFASIVPVVIPIAWIFGFSKKKIYCICQGSKSELNSTLTWMIRLSGGDIFKTYKEVLTALETNDKNDNFIKEFEGEQEFTTLETKLEESNKLIEPKKEENKNEKMETSK